MPGFEQEGKPIRQSSLYLGSRGLGIRDYRMRWGGRARGLASHKGNWVYGCEDGCEYDAVSHLGQSGRRDGVWRVGVSRSFPCMFSASFYADYRLSMHLMFAS